MGGYMRRCFISCLLLSGCLGQESTEQASLRRCERLRDHLVDLQVGQIHVATGVDREAHRRALTQALGNGFVTSCSEKLSESQVDCALETSDPASAAACGH